MVVMVEEVVVVVHGGGGDGDKSFVMTMVVQVQWWKME